MNSKTVVLNGERINYDGAFDYKMLAPLVTVYEDTPSEQILERVEGYGIIVTKELPLPAHILSRFPDSVKLICEAGTGYNNIDLTAAKEKGIVVCNIPAYSTQRVAQTALLHMLCLASSMQVQMKMLGIGDTSNFTQHLRVPHTELNGKILGIIGAGDIGSKVIELGLALGMETLVFTRTPRQDQPGIHYTTLDEVLEKSDYLSLHCPLTDATRHIINADTLSKMKPSACIINTARGALIDETALIDALKNGRLAGAGLDVQEEEPPAGDSPLYTMEQVVLTPHMGWKGLETRRRLLDILAGNIKAYLEGSPINVVSL